MNLFNKEILVLGLGISGISTIKALHKLGARISVTDTKNEKDLEGVLNELSDIPFKKYFNIEDMDIQGIDLIIKSPGILPTVKIIKRAVANNIEVITDIELAYRLSTVKNLIAITGTNGKTTTTTLTWEIFKAANYNTFLGGNIGIGILDNILDVTDNDVFIIEVSSFQLENTNYFKPYISLILNIKPDHLNWHGTFENYIHSKLKIFQNQDNKGYLILNYDDIILRKIGNQVETNIVWFSLNEKLDKGIYLDGENIVINDGQKITELMNYKDIKILGKHNIENALGSIGICVAFGIDLMIIKKVLREFKGVEHRLEYVNTIKGISFYNDSKGTNPDSTIKAIEAFNNPIILIAGGYEKGSDYNGLFKVFNNKVKELILIGETKERFKDTAIQNEFNNFHLVESMEEAVRLAYKLGEENYNILLSPASASWDMYSNFEERGNHFKKIVLELEEDNYVQKKES